MKELLLLATAGLVGWLVYDKVKEDNKKPAAGTPRLPNPLTVELEDADPDWPNLVKLPGGISGLSVRTAGCATCGGRHE